MQPRFLLLGDEQYQVIMAFTPEVSYDIRVRFYLHEAMMEEIHLPVKELIRNLGLTPQIMREVAMLNRRSPDTPDDYPLVPTADELADRCAQIAKTSASRGSARSGITDVFLDVLREMGYSRAVDAYLHPERWATYDVDLQP